MRTDTKEVIIEAVVRAIENTNIDTEYDYDGMHHFTKHLCHDYVRANCFGMNYGDLGLFGRLHQFGNDAIKDMIEYILTDINFHYECSLLADGDYSTFWKCVRESKLAQED